MIGFFDIDKILTENERVYCTVNEEFRDGLGSLLGAAATIAGSNNTSRIELPFWLALELANYNVVEFEGFPTCFQSLERIKANPLVVSLHEMCPNFYRLGIILISLMETDGSLKQVLAQTLLDRITMILNWSMSSKSRVANPNSTHDFIAILDETERNLYKLGLSSKVEMDRWMNQKCNRIRAIRTAK